MLSPDQIRQRAFRLTASRIAPLMTGDEQKLLELWRLLSGDPSYVEHDLSDVWAVQRGTATEPLNLRWFTHKFGKELTRHGQVVVHPKFDWAAATLDAWIEGDGHPLEAKDVGGFEPIDRVLARYCPQAHWLMEVTGARKCVFTIIEGGREPTIHVVERDETYAKELLTRACAFWLCVETMTPPVAPPPAAAPVKAEKVYDMTGSNSWWAHAATWLSTIQAKKDCEKSERELKALVPADAERCFGASIEIKRNKAGSLSIRTKE
jgi:predicted phage-related endonuclease